MPTITRTERAAHGIALTPDAETIVDLDGAPSTVEVVVTTPGAAPIYWTADDSPATLGGPNTRLIPAGVIASDSLTPRRLTAAGVVSSRVRLISEAAATVTVQKG